MRTYFHLLAGCILCLFLESSCSDSASDITPPSPMPSSVPVSFSALAQWDDTPKARLAEDGNTVSFTSGDAIGVFAYHNNSTTPNFMNNQKVTYDGNAWTYEPVKYWPSDEEDKVDFYGYYPWWEDDSSNRISVDVSSSDGPILTYESLNDETDLLTASCKQQSYATKAGTANLPFEHQLARVKFRFRNDWKEEEDRYRLGINYFYVSYESNSILKYEYGGSVASYSAATAKQRLTAVINADGYYPYSSTEYHDVTAPLYLVPDFIKDGTIELGVDVYEMVNGKWKKITEHSTPSYIVKATLPDKDNLAKGFTLVYNISYKPTAGLTITMITEVDGWTEVDNDNKI